MPLYDFFRKAKLGLTSWEYVKRTDFPSLVEAASHAKKFNFMLAPADDASRAEFQKYGLPIPDITIPESVVQSKLRLRGEPKEEDKPLYHGADRKIEHFLPTQEPAPVQEIPRTVELIVPTKSVIEPSPVPQGKAEIQKGEDLGAGPVP